MIKRILTFTTILILALCVTGMSYAQQSLGPEELNSIENPFTMASSMSGGVPPSNCSPSAGGRYCGCEFYILGDIYFNGTVVMVNVTWYEWHDASQMTSEQCEYWTGDLDIDLGNGAVAKVWVTSTIYNHNLNEPRRSYTSRLEETHDSYVVPDPGTPGCLWTFEYNADKPNSPNYYACVEVKSLLEEYCVKGAENLILVEQLPPYQNNCTTFTENAFTENFLSQEVHCPTWCKWEAAKNGATNVENITGHCETVEDLCRAQVTTTLGRLIWKDWDSAKCVCEEVEVKEPE